MNKKCTYNVYLADGVRRMSGYSVLREYGTRALNLSTEVVEHSEWCKCYPVPANVGPDVFLGDVGPMPF